MEKRMLGKTGIKVSTLAFGGNVLGWTIDEKRSYEVLDTFVSAGCNFIDTADVYSRWASGIGGESETILGNWMKKRANRQNLIIATKVGKDMGNGRIGLSKKYILQAVNDSLKRLQTDYIDLYQSHDDDKTVPLEETLDAYQQLIKEGKVRVIGASNYSTERLKQALDISSRFNLPRYECLQPHYNLMERGLFEGPTEQLCIAEHLSVIPYYSLASGFLTGKYRNPGDKTKSVRGTGATRYLNTKGINVLSALDKVAAEKKCSVAAVALAWLMDRPSVTAPIASTTSSEQMHSLLASLSLQLSAKDLDLLDSASDTILEK